MPRTPTSKKPKVILPTTATTYQEVQLAFVTPHLLIGTEAKLIRSETIEYNKRNVLVQLFQVPDYSDKFTTVQSHVRTQVIGYQHSNNSIPSQANAPFIIPVYPITSRKEALEISDLIARDIKPVSDVIRFHTTYLSSENSLCSQKIR